MSLLEGNAKIVYTKLGKEDHGIPSFMLGLERDVGTQGFGGWDLRFENYALRIFDLLDVLELPRWESLVGTYCRYRGATSQKIPEIGHITKDKWFKMGSSA